MNKKLFLTGAAAFVAAGAMAVASVSAATTQGEDSDTTITYTNNDVVSENGMYGLVVPASMAFQSSIDQPTMDIEMVGVNGYVMDDFNTALRVEVKASSANDMELIEAADTSKKVAYTLDFGATEITATSLATADGSKTNAKKIAEFSPAKASTKVTGSLVNPGDATVKGTYSDVVTFSWTDNGQVLK